MISSAEKKPEGRGRGRPVALVVLLVALAGAGSYWYLVAREAPAPEAPTARPSPAATPRPTPSPPASGTGTVAITATREGAVVFVDGRRVGVAPRRVDLDAGSHAIQVEKDGFHTFEREVHVVPGRTLELEANLAAVGPRLSVSADVPGAHVFLDRTFVGEAPVVIRDVAPGLHRLNVSAKGYDGFREDIEVGPGMNEVHVRLKVVRLDESIAVEHKHTFGSCEGRLVATTDGLRYETDDENDAFELPFSSLEPLEVDYLDENLRVKVRGGRTYNFTAESADDLLTFHRSVEDARERLD